MTKQPDNIISIEFSPESNRNMLQYSILRVRIRVRRRRLETPPDYRVMIRTNLNQARRIRRQVIDLVERGLSYSTDYYDVTAEYSAETDFYYADILLNEVGYFEFKVHVESLDPQHPWTRWAPGENVGITVTPLEYGRNNSIYCAFIRQYGRDSHKKSLVDEKLETTINDLEQKGAYVLPPGGNFEKFAEVLPFVIEKLGMKIIHLLPINPVPSAYGRMGMYGSPYATTDYFGIDHTYGTFSRFKTIEDQFVDLTSTIHGLGAKVFLDMVINHTGWASSILFTHRQWIKVGPDRRIISPGAWGTIWGDLVELDYQHKDLWQYMANVFLVWCRRGIDGFRLDAGYMVPIEVWQYIISKVREEFPNTLFLLEGLGGPWETTEKLLTEGQINWAYSELFQNYTKDQITHYLDYARHVSAGKGVMVHYAETHDNDRLAKQGKTYTRMRLQLCAFTSFAGAWGFTNGVEWLATEKINVHRNTGLNWGAEENLVEDISTINQILGENPAFWERDNLIPFETKNEAVYGFIRKNTDQTNVIVCLINLNTEESKAFRCDHLPLHLKSPIWFGQDDMVFHNLLNDTYRFPAGTTRFQGRLDPGECLLYRLEQKDEAYQPRVPAIFDVEYNKISLIYKILLSRFKSWEAGLVDQEKLLRQVNDIRKFIVLVNSVSLDFLINNDIEQSLQQIDEDMIEQYSSLWTFRESSKEFIISGDKWLIIHTFVPCTAYLETPGSSSRAESIRMNDELGQLTCFPPQGENISAKLKFYWKIKRDKKIERMWQKESYPILSVPSGRKKPRTRKIYPIRLDKSKALDNYASVLLTNGIGGGCQCPAQPGAVNSKYDTLLSITEDPGQPGNRTALAKMLLETVQVGEKFFDLDKSFLTAFTRYPHPVWEFTYDDGEYYVVIHRSLIMPYGDNSLFVRYKIKEANTQVNLIVKCYLEYRSIHENFHVSADAQVREEFEQACKAINGVGVLFAPESDLRVHVQANSGTFIELPHWIYNIVFPQDAQRGLDQHGDAFSPGLFKFQLQKGNSGVLSLRAEQTHTIGMTPPQSAYAAETATNKRLKEMTNLVPVDAARKDPLVKMMIYALDQFLVRLDGKWVIMAGYPWLPARVHDNLHCVGGLMATGREEIAREIILQVAATEKNGLPADWLDSNPPTRTSTESALRLFLAVKTYLRHTGDDSILDRSVEGYARQPKTTNQPYRTLREILVNIYEHLRSPHEAEIDHMPVPRLDPETGLLYSPACYSWMNTTYPAATPRQGYPVEIQVFWYQALGVLADIFPPHAEEAGQLRERFTRHFLPLFWNDKRNYLADVLLTDAFGPATKSLPDSALRFNQLSAINAGLVPPDKARKAIDIITRRLVIPAGVRSLSEEPLSIPLEIRDKNGKLLTDPRLPYRGECRGDETSRRLAYHNGAAWPSAYPSFIEARAAAYQFSDLAVKQALAFFEPIRTHLTEGCTGSIAEMKEGNYPHRACGCYAFALAVSEAIRIYMLLKYQKNFTPHHTYQLNSSTQA